jgi:hypothetical protein
MLTIKCNLHGCKATITVPHGHDAAERHGWKQEAYGLFSHRLCPEHRRKTWFQVREQIDPTTLRSNGPGMASP